MMGRRMLGGYGSAPLPKPDAGGPSMPAGPGGPGGPKRRQLGSGVMGQPSSPASQLAPESGISPEMDAAVNPGNVQTLLGNDPNNSDGMQTFLKMLGIRL
jgi:hypothetical protein